MKVLLFHRWNYFYFGTSVVRLSGRPSLTLLGRFVRFASGLLKLCRLVVIDINKYMA